MRTVNTKVSPEEIAAARSAMRAIAVDHVPGSLRAGVRIEKVGAESGDAHANGALGRIVGVMPVAVEGEFAYFVAWDDMPEAPVFTRGKRVREVVDG